MVDKNTTGPLADPRPAVSAAELSALSDHFGESEAGRYALKKSVALDKIEQGGIVRIDSRRPHLTYDPLPRAK